MKLNGYKGTITPGQGWLYKDGKTDYTLLIPTEATEAERFAAEELTWIFSLAGVAVQTVTDEGVTVDPTAKYIAIGNTVYFKALNTKLTQKEFKFDGFILESLGNTYVIKGVGDTGTCFGVYGFGEYVMGYRYYAEDEYTVAGEAKNLQLHIKDIPTFFGRNAFSHDTTYHRDHGFRLRINGEFCSRDAKHGEGRPWSTLHDMSNALQILDYKKYRDEHPDWFYVKPENWNAKPPSCHPQICFSRGMLPESEGGFHELFMSNLINNYIIPEHDKMFFMLGMSDTWDFCQCDLCKAAVEKYTRSGLSMRFNNMIADEVEAWRRENAPEREIYMIAFAYHTTFEAPVRKEGDKYIPVDESVIGRDNLIIQYAPIRANYLYPILDPVHNAASRESLLGWAAVAKHLAVWDYRQDFRDVVFPFPSAPSAQANNDIYADLGVMDVFNQAQRFCPGSPFIDMDNFARAKMHWNRYESYDELCDEFRKAYYKQCEPAVTEYWEAVRAFWKVMEERGYSGDPHWTISRRPGFNRVEELEHFKEILERALALALTEQDEAIREKLRKRVEVLQLYWRFTLLYCFPFEKSEAEMLALLEDTRRITDENEVKYFHFWNFTTDFYADCEKVIRKEIAPEERNYKANPDNTAR